MTAPWTVVGHMLAEPALLHAYAAGTAVAAACGLVGYFLVLRMQVFTVDALSHVAFTGALAALAAGLDARLGLVILTVAVALLMGVLDPRGRADDAVIGGVFAWVLGLGVLCLGLYTTGRSGSDGSAGVTVLFGSILGLSAGRAAWTAAVTGVVVAVLVVGWRPLLFASVDPDVAAARGLPVRVIGLGFLAATAVTAAAATQVVGALLLLGLVAAPAGVAVNLTTRPLVAAIVSVTVAVLSVWLGLVVAYAVPRVPPSFAIVAVATAAFGAGTLWRRLGRSPVRVRAA